MSEPKLVSPLLDGFAMGVPLSNHDGVCCCPAMKENSDDKYIVKIISVPASQRQLDALLLTGAYKDAAAAMEYFKELSDGIVEEAELLLKLAKLEGFLPYERWQIVPMENNDLGYDVYLLGSYKHSLGKYMERNLLTHLNAVNLGLDLCAALAICRKAGYLYVDLKPSNIFISEDKEYRIGDLGFAKLDSLKYTSLPSKYRSAYSAPEVRDAMATLNETVDIYAAGLILYQVYNNGQLPAPSQDPAEPFPSPVNADYEIAEIILKACAPDPKDRWSDPIEMGQALVAYMQRNSVNDTPIAPPSAHVDVSETQEPEAQDQNAETHEELAFMDEMVSDDTAPSEDDIAQLNDEPVTEEVSSMLSEADDLIAHEAPAPEKPEEPIPVPAFIQNASKEVSYEAVNDEMDDEQETEELASFLQSHSAPVVSPDTAQYSAYDDEDEDLDEDEEEEISNAEPLPKEKKKRHWVLPLILGVILAAAAAAGLYFYQNFYLQTIDSMDLTPHEDRVTVILDTEIDNSLLTVVCTDTYGNSMKQAVENNQVVFQDLKPSTMYRIDVTIDGFHKLDGSTTANFTSADQTQIVRFAAATGPEDGSVVLDFTVEGPETEDWTVTYSTDGEEAKTVNFTGHMVTITGLTVDKTYQFELQPATELYLAGENILQFTASRIIVAEDLAIVAFRGGVLSVSWNAPEGASVESWSVRCYTEDGYDQTITTPDTVASFDSIEWGKAYTVEVTAAAMTQPARTSITANPITITGFSAGFSDMSSPLCVDWQFEGEAPEGGWLLMYTIDGGETPAVIQCETNSAEISPMIPGATYDFEIQTARVGTTVFESKYSYQVPNAETFNDYEVVVKHWNFQMCRTPNKDNWTYHDVPAADYTTSFTVGEKISFIIRGARHYIPREDIQILYVIRDAEGRVVSDLTSTETRDWFLMWNYTYPNTSLTIPKAPTEPGTYQLYLYFNGKAVTVLEFTITE